MKLEAWPGRFFRGAKHWYQHLPVVQTLHVLEVHPVSDGLHKVFSHSVEGACVLEREDCMYQFKATYLDSRIYSSKHIEALSSLSPRQSIPSIYFFTHPPPPLPLKTQTLRLDFEVNSLMQTVFNYETEGRPNLVGKQGQAHRCSCRNNMTDSKCVSCKYPYNQTKYCTLTSVAKAWSVSFGPRQASES